MINILDIVIIFLILMAGLIGFKRGFIRSSVGFIGTILIAIIAYSLKNPVANFMMTHLPFIDFGGLIKGVTVVNILIYEAMAFVVIFSILQLILKLVIHFTKILEGILKATVVLGIPSKILGGIFGLLEGYIYAFILLFVFSLFSFSMEVSHNSKLNPVILNNTPILSKFSANYYKSINEIYELSKKYKEIENKDEFNKEALDVFINYKVISKDTVKILVNQGKIKEN